MQTKSEKGRIIWLRLRPLVIFVISLAIAVFLFVFCAQYVLNHYIYPVDQENTEPITVVIPQSSSASTIASILHENELISNTAIFKVYVDFVGKANKLQAGTYVLSKNMDIIQIVDTICAGNPPKATVRFTVPEGSTVEEIATILQDAGLLTEDSQKREFLDLCKTGEQFKDTYEFLQWITEDEKKDRDYILEGYLFPDTYEVYMDASPKTIINRMLLRFFDIFTTEDMERAQELNMSVDEITTLASMIEREAQEAQDFSKVSAVFHNRLGIEQKLESCASLSYALKVKKYVFNATERATDSKYNTYLYQGLPVGPISNPGRQAIQAALHPNEEYLTEYFYFCNANPEETKALVFSKTYEEHLKNQEKYSQYW